MKVFLKAGDQIYLNGANIKVDRKVSIELLNKTKFMLQNHILSADEADSPMKRLYFAIQLMIMNSTSPNEARKLYQNLLASLIVDNQSPSFSRLIRQIDHDVGNDREFQALKTIRENFPLKR